MFPEPCKAALRVVLQVEPFAPVLTVVRLPTQGVTQFLEEAVRFANEDLWGTLSCTLVLHPNTEKQYPAESEKVGRSPGPLPHRSTGGLPQALGCI